MGLCSLVKGYEGTRTLVLKLNSIHETIMPRFENIVGVIECR